MGHPYYGRGDIEGRRFDDDRERWEDQGYERVQREGTRFDENRWRGRERPQGYVQGMYNYGERGYGERSPSERSFGERSFGERSFGERGYARDYNRDEDRDVYGFERYYPGRRVGRYGEGFRPEREEERWSRGRDPRDQDDDRSMLERVGDRVREGFREGMRRLGRGPKGFKRSDERIAEDVCERIARSHINAENVEVKVKDGEVTLTGFVDHRYDKRNLEDITDDVFGVSEVHNQLRVQQQAMATQRTGTTQTTTTQTTQEKGGRVTHS